MTTYSYQVSAVDYSGNESPRSMAVNATTLPQTEFIIDNTRGLAIGSWTTGSSSGDKFMDDYQWMNTSATATGTFRWTPRIEIPGYYSIQVWYPQGANRCTNSQYAVVHAGGTITVRVNQTSGGGSWVSLGTSRPLVTGTNGYVELSNASVDAGKVVMADAVRFVYSTALAPLSSPSIAMPPGGKPALTWSSPYAVLQESTSALPGTWKDVPGATSPFQLETGSGPQKFYRTRY
jgi:hypothetical protein